MSDGRYATRYFTTKMNLQILLGSMVPAEYRKRDRITLW